MGARSELLRALEHRQLQHPIACYNQQPTKSQYITVYGPLPGFWVAEEAFDARPKCGTTFTAFEQTLVSHGSVRASTEAKIAFSLSTLRWVPQARRQSTREP